MFNSNLQTNEGNHKRAIIMIQKEHQLAITNHAGLKPLNIRSWISMVR